MATYTTIAEAKAHLRVDFSEDDIYIASLQDMVEELVAMEIGENLIELEDDGVLPPPLKQAMLLMIGHFYANRESVVIGVGATELPFGYKYLLAPYKNYTAI